MTYPVGNGNFRDNLTNVPGAIIRPVIDQTVKHPAQVVEHTVIPAVTPVVRTTIEGKDRMMPAIKGWAFGRNNELKKRFIAWRDRLKTR